MTPDITWPTFAELAPQDQAQVAQFLHKVEWEGEDYARSDYPCRFQVDTLLSGLTDKAACDLALMMIDDVQAIPGEEFVELANRAV